jgi:hypothetical protein
MNHLKSFLLTLVFTGYVLSAGSQTLHAIMFVDTYDSSIGESCAVDYAKMANEFQATADHAQLTLKKYYFKGASFTKDNLVETIENLKVSGSDIVYFYYSGHGFRYDNQDKIWPRLALGRKGQALRDRDTDLNWVKAKIEEKGAKVNIILADCCNSLIGINLPPSEAYEEDRDLIKRNYEVLFKKFTGTVISSGCVPGQYSFCNPEEGGWFTNFFLKTLHYSVENESMSVDTAWKNLLQTTKSKTSVFARNKGREQTPQFDIGDYADPFRD